MTSNFNWTNTAICIAGKFGDISSEECKIIEDQMHLNMKGGDVLIAPYGEVLVDGDRQVGPEGFAGFSVLVYFSGQANLSHQIIQHGRFGSLVSYKSTFRLPNAFNSAAPGIWTFDSWMGRFPFIMMAIKVAGQIKPTTVLKVLTCLSYLFMRPSIRNINLTVSAWLASQVIFLHFPVVGWCIKQYYKRMSRVWTSPSQMLASYCKDEKSEIIKSWQGKDWHFSF